MKKKVVSLLISAIMVATSAMPAFAATKLNRPVIDSISHTDSAIDLDWDSVNHADSYKIYRSTHSDSGFKYIATTDWCSYRDDDVIKNVRYYYKVRAISYSGKYDSSRLSKWRSNKIPKPKATVSQTVYITRTGAKYHRYGCQYLRQSCIAVSKSNAVSSGYTACSVCW